MARIKVYKNNQWQYADELLAQPTLPNAEALVGANLETNIGESKLNINFLTKNFKTNATTSSKVDLYDSVRELAQYPKNGIFLNASPQATQENGMVVYASEFNGNKLAKVSLGPKMQEAWQKALNIGTTQDLNNVEIVGLGWGMQGWFTRYGQTVFVTAYGNINNYGSGKMGEKIPDKFIPKEVERFTGVCINNMNHSGNIRVDFGKDGSIYKYGTYGHQEYSFAGSYLAKN